MFGSSGMLARQIENGAPFDVYLSANEKFVRDLAAQGRIDPATVTPYATGRVAIWSKQERYRSLAGLRKASRIAIPNPAHAPYGVAAWQALEKQGLWSELEARVVYGENVRQAYQYAASGNADVVLTSWTLVFDRGGVLIPANLHEPVRQCAGVIATTRNRTVAGRFLEFLVSKEGRALLARHGLFPPD